MGKQKKIIGKIINTKNFDGVETSTGYIVKLPKSFEKLKNIQARGLANRSLYIYGEN
jgi:hypothetical protein